MSIEKIRKALDNVKIEKWVLDYMKTAIGCENEKIGGFAKLFDVRGWGYFTGTGHGGLGLCVQDAQVRQQAMAAYVVETNPAAITELLAAHDALKAENEALKHGHKILSDFVRDHMPEGQDIAQADINLAHLGFMIVMTDRAEAAEAEVKRMREALESAREEFERIYCLPTVTETANARDQFDRAVYFAKRGAITTGEALKGNTNGTE